MPAIRPNERQQSNVISSVIAVRPGEQLELVLAITGAPGTARYICDEIETPVIDYEESFTNAQFAAEAYRITRYFSFDPGGTYALTAVVTTPPRTGQRLVRARIGERVVFSQFVASSPDQPTVVMLTVLVI